MKKFLILSLFLFSFVACQPMKTPFPQGTMIDLTHPYDETTIYWPTEEGFRLRNEFFGMTDKGYFYSSNRFSTPEHGGTHIDAPIHFNEKGRPANIQENVGTENRI